MEFWEKTCKQCGKEMRMREFNGILYFVCKKCQIYEKYRKIEINLKNRKEVEEMAKKKLYSVPEMAKILGISVSQMRYWVYRGKVPFYRVGGRMLFDENDVDAIRWFVSFHSKRGRRAIKEEMKKAIEEKEVAT
jgi:excisionase family DNA binding protein